MISMISEWHGMTDCDLTRPPWPSWSPCRNAKSPRSAELWEKGTKHCDIGIPCCILNQCWPSFDVVSSSAKATIRWSAMWSLLIISPFSSSNTASAAWELLSRWVNASSRACASCSFVCVAASDASTCVSLACKVSLVSACSSNNCLCW